MTRDDSSQGNQPSRFGFNSSFSTSGSVSASTKASSNQLGADPSITTTTSSLSADADTVGPFHMEISRPNISMASMALSPYSPLTLRSLPQPVPSDVPSNLDASIFTFEDAFEDLLAVSQGQPLPEITARHDQRKLLRSMFPDGEPAFFWLRRLKSQGLLDMSSPSQLLAQAADANWDYFHRELDRRAANVWRAVAGEDARESRDIFDDDDNFPGSFRENPASEPLRRRREPDHFDDFFSSIQSSFSNSQSSWDSFVKSITDSPSTSLDKPQEDRALDKNQEVIKDEYVDRFGYLHSKVTVKTFDEDGNQIGTQTHYSFRPADKPVDNSKDEDKDEDKSGIHAEGRVETKTGWLWK
ncbi:hypothetical protein AK830_g8946 [Neonectria ditissima]|uniref:Uncharacterized protein n=1 Tax=Neonectria ditissima TaxID=78410 RepID=A0A0P7BB16_9HYPO|nr:hypothetical protein AK830_g8946 [Neonectria ditissima]